MLVCSYCSLFHLISERRGNLFQVPQRMSLKDHPQLLNGRLILRIWCDPLVHSNKDFITLFGNIFQKLRYNNSQSFHNTLDPPELPGVAVGDTEDENTKTRICEGCALQVIGPLIVNFSVINVKQNLICIGTPHFGEDCSHIL